MLSIWAKLAHFFEMSGPERVERYKALAGIGGPLPTPDPSSTLSSYLSCLS